MKPIKLLPQEALVYEGIKAGKRLFQINEELGFPKSRTMCCLKRMVKLGVIIRTGERRKYTYQASGNPYEVVAKRGSVTLEPAEDTLLISLEGFELPEQQLQYLRDNYKKMTRSQLCKKLMLSRLELAHVMHKHGLKQRVIKGESNEAHR